MRTYRNVVYTKGGNGSEGGSPLQQQLQQPSILQTTTSPLQSRLITPKSQALRICFGNVNESPTVTLTPKGGLMAKGQAQGQAQTQSQIQQQHLQKQLQQLQQQQAALTQATAIVATKSSTANTVGKSQVEGVAPKVKIF